MIRNNTLLISRSVADITQESDRLFIPFHNRRFRIRIGRDATLSYLLKRFLPEGIRLQSTKMLYRRIFHQENQ